MNTIEENGANMQIDTQDNSVRQLSFDEKIKHFGEGYANSQATVRFLDTKAAVAIGVVPVLLGILAAVFDWTKEFWNWPGVVEITSPVVPIVAYIVFAVIAIALMVVAALCVMSAFNAILPRDTGNTGPSILFPLHSTEYASRVDHFVNVPTVADAIEDYQRQLVRMSEIVLMKMENVNRSIKHLKHLFFVAAIALCLMVLLAVGTVLIVGQSDAPSHAGTTSAVPRSAFPE